MQSAPVAGIGGARYIVPLQEIEKTMQSTGALT
jgi:hypothetical protein